MKNGWTSVVDTAGFEVEEWRLEAWKSDYRSRRSQWWRIKLLMKFYNLDASYFKALEKRYLFQNDFNGFPWVKGEAHFKQLFKPQSFTWYVVKAGEYLDMLARIDHVIRDLRKEKIIKFEDEWIKKTGGKA